MGNFWPHNLTSALTWHAQSRYVLCCIKKCQVTFSEDACSVSFIRPFLPLLHLSSQIHLHRNSYIDIYLTDREDQTDHCLHFYIEGSWLMTLIALWLSGTAVIKSTEEKSDSLICPRANGQREIRDRLFFIFGSCSQKKNMPGKFFDYLLCWKLKNKHWLAAEAVVW